MIISHEILKCIASKREGPYWDFKREWYKNDDKGRIDLLFDIICMNNITFNHDSYIIIGVDEENDYNTVDISDDPNRKNTQNLTDFINARKFAGDIRPIVHVENITINKKAIDVIVVHNNLLTPIYLFEDYKGIKAHHIYSRLQDSNTPINKSADQHIVEALWKKRFGLNLNPLQRMKLYLKDYKNWTKKEKREKGIFYYNDFPEFTIEYSYDSEDGLDGYEYYLFSQADSKPGWNDIKLKYHQTELEEYEGMFLDGGRNLMCIPDTGVIGHLDDAIVYKYYMQDSLKDILNNFLKENYSNETEFSTISLMNCILYFDSIEEKNDFEKYALMNKNNLPDCEDKIPYIGEIKGYTPGYFKSHYRQALQLITLLNEFRTRKFSL